ncbi:MULTISPECIES: aspartate 1-decarboxylase [Spirulina sp. CCY15215]|uniref:aspartate 1-decarboxylase n=1 Tax=Spirulina sp. CCY15215 TaxID=2767591 RepID=UPI0019524AAB|nr:aspartate 1-decarboxylase [Spirulina major]
MGTIKLMHAKLHRVHVTEAKLHYIGSITIDRELLEKVGIIPLEEVEVVNLENGNRWTTYVIPGEAGSRQICCNGGGALLCQPGDILIIWANEQYDRAEVMTSGHKARVLLADENNGIEKVFSHTLTPDGNALVYEDGYKFPATTFC